MGQKNKERWGGVSLSQKLKITDNFQGKDLTFLPGANVFEGISRSVAYFTS